ncbi:MAG: hypothetical protein AB7S26_11450 [Sandaracinaceae bacterium]
MRRSLPAALAAVLCAACAPLGYSGRATIPHPRTAELRAAGTQIALPAADKEARLGLRHGVLVDRAALRSVDASEVCVQVALWSLDDDPARGQLGEYDVTLRTEGAHDRALSHPRWANEQGWVERRNATRVAYSFYAAWRTEVVVPIRYRASDACFAGADAIDESTRRVSLVLSRGGRELRFEWDLDREARYAMGADDGALIHPAADDPAPMTQAGAQNGGGGGGLTAISVGEQIPGGHPLDVEELRRLVDGRFERMRQCLSHAAEADPRLNQMRGTMIAEFTVGPSGVRNVRVVANDFTPGAAQCLERYVSELPIPPDPRRWTSMFRYGVTTDPNAVGAR